MSLVPGEAGEGENYMKYIDKIYIWTLILYLAKMNKLNIVIVFIFHNTSSVLPILN